MTSVAAYSLISPGFGCLDPPSANSCWSWHRESADRRWPPVFPMSTPMVRRSSG